MAVDKKRGQIAVLVALSMTLLFLLLAMVTNISYLVTAKINLQNAVDLASYAGAAQQARYLTEIGKWNYEMRRNYKAFVYDYVIYYNSEKSMIFKKYLDNYNSPPPSVALTLSRKQSVNSNEIYNLFFETRDSLENVSNNIERYTRDLQRMADAFRSIGLDNLTEDIITTPLRDVFQNTRFFDNLINENYKFDMHNYNSRLINWAAFDYRNLQARIRGVNFTGLEFSTTENRLLSNSKDSPGIKIFENAPISVASKVINGFVGDNPAAYDNNSLELTEDTTSNPMHNAAYYTFKKNLLSLNSKFKLFFLNNNYAKISGTNKMGDSGCDAKCEEFIGPSLKLNAYDVSIIAMFSATEIAGGNIKIFDYVSGVQAGKKYYKKNISETSHPYLIDNFPVGVAKDARVKTYYPLIAITNTEYIPFNVFFGADEASYNPPLIAVSASKPYGSRIGPYVDEKCPDFKKPEEANCVLNGTDPRVSGSFNTDDSSSEILAFLEKHFYPDFTTNNENTDITNTFGGVKGTVIKKELNSDTSFSPVSSGGSNAPSPNLSLAPPIVNASATPYSNTNPSKYLNLYTMGFKKNARYKQARDGKLDDGICNNSEPNCSRSNDNEYIEKKNIHPQNYRNSIIAWNSNPSIEDPGTDFESYLNKLVGKAIYAFPNLRENLYRVYTFKYPKLSGEYWNIENLVKTNENTHDSMEFSFANTMAVNEFEIYRYIIPNSEGVADNVLKWYDIAKGNVYKKLNDDRSKIINVEVFDNLIKEESSSANNLSDESEKMESYTAWRTGLRGYKVKLTSIKELINGSGDFANPLYQTYTIKDFNDEEITVDLTKINY